MHFLSSSCHSDTANCTQDKPLSFLEKLPALPAFKALRSHRFQVFENFLRMTPARSNRLRAVLSSRQNDLTVVLENVTDPHNISAVMRSCDAVGISEIYVLTTRIPPHKKWGFRSSSSAAKWLTVHAFDGVQPCVQALRAKYSHILTTHLGSHATSLYDLDLTQKTALVFGNEQAGVSNEMRGLADGDFVIPQHGMIQSLNISVACAVSVYEAYRQKAQAGHYAVEKLTAAERDTLFTRWALHPRAAPPPAD